MNDDTISRRAAIDAFMTATSDGDKAEWCRWVLKQLPSAQPEQRWIPCSERLPDSKEYVLVTDYGETNMGRRFCDRWWLNYCGDKMKDITAWMPLPEPYKAESEEV